jgi:phage terminase large subunit-like protein
VPPTQRSKTTETQPKGEGSQTRNGNQKDERIFSERSAGAIASPTREKQPFTVPHFRAWAADLILDTGEPWILEPFQAAFLKDLFSGFLESLLIIPEGNAKTTFAAGIALYHARFRKYASVPVAASSRDQAEWLYQAAAGFVERSPAIEKLFKCLGGYRRIRCDSVGSRIQIFAADDRTGDGIIPTLAILEELHRHKNLSLYRTWRGKMEKRGGQLVGISTAGEPDGEFEALRKRIRDECEVTCKGSFLRATSETTVLHEYAVPEDRDPEDIEEVFKANPLKAITRAQLKRKLESKAMTPAHWRRFVCGQAVRLESWVEPQVWDALKWDVGHVVEGEPVYVCVRVATGIGIGIVALRGEKAAVKLRTIPPPLSGRVPLWEVEAALRDIDKFYEVMGITYDADQFLRPAEILEEEGLPMIEIPQRARRLSQATSTMWRYISGGLLGHDGDPELRSQVLAAQTKETIQGWHLDPEPHTPGVIAVALALHDATEAPAPEPMFVLPSGVA